MILAVTGDLFLEVARLQGWTLDIGCLAINLAFWRGVYLSTANIKNNLPNVCPRMQ